MIQLVTIIGLAAMLLGPGADLTVVGVSPSARGVAASLHPVISVRFDRPVDRASVVAMDSFWAFGRWSGVVSGAIGFADSDRVITLTPDRKLTAGESVMVLLSRDLRGADGSAMRLGGYSFQFMTPVRPALLDLQLVDTLSTNISGESSRPYGGIATDLDGDGWLDLTTVNEDTSDLRVMMNRGDGTFEPLAGPTFSTGNIPSPSEPTDFDRDGIVDICTANTQGSSVSILLGDGSGGFGTQQLVTVGGNPRGIAVLDADGDGDVDIVNTNNASGQLSLLLNDGSGVFGAPSFFDSGGAGEWALGAADMNNDGLLDLVVGARTSQQMIVMLNDGAGSFVAQTPVPAGGSPWMLVLGDLDGDGNEDVSAANATQDVGAILLGDGTGQLGAPDTYPTDDFPLATDLGDIDGDGDLDWITASFGGDWFLFLNDGDGTFTFEREFLAPSNSSCSLMLDIDNDDDLDLALIDEIADTVEIYDNLGTLGAGATSGLQIATLPGDQLLAAWNSSCNVADDDYALYEGMLGDFASHRPVTCSTGGAKNWSFTPLAASTYYLAVPRQGMLEGSHGTTATGVQRPTGQISCADRVVLACPAR